MERFDARINRLSAHLVGNKIAEGELVLSSEEIALLDDELEGLLWKYFINSFKIPEYYAFTSSNEDPNLNPMFQYVSNIFESGEHFHQESINIAKHLFDATSHAQIKDGELFLAYISNMIVDDEMVDAIGIFKSESKDFFLQTERQENKISVKYDKGININKLDKGCLIYKTDKSEGYKIQIIDNSNKVSEAQYWRDNFLGLVALSDEYHHTNHYLKLTKNFVTKRMNEDPEVSKADQIDYLNKSMDYFKTNDSFEGQSFASSVFDTPNQVAAFDDYKSAYAEQKNVEIIDSFDISDAAVKKNQRVYKSVLKLDKNFHVYIHGDRTRIERGKEADGRKFYKIYYTEEA